MSTKHDSQCLIKAADDEPIFVLRAKDPTAPLIVRANSHGAISACFEDGSSLGLKPEEFVVTQFH